MLEWYCLNSLITDLHGLNFLSIPLRIIGILFTKVGQVFSRTGLFGGCSEELACLLQGWKRWGASGFTLLALTSDLRKLVLLVNRCHDELKNKRHKTGYEGLTQKNYKLR